MVIAGSIATIAHRAGDHPLPRGSATYGAEGYAPLGTSPQPSASGTAPQASADGSTPLPSATDPEASGSPEAVTSAYYAALHAQNAQDAFTLLCPQQQAEGEKAFAANVVRDQQTGTGIAAFVRTGDATVQGSAATVPGHVRLEDGQSVAIHVLLVQDGDTWEVCSSDLGGVLPGPGASSAAV